MCACDALFVCANCRDKWPLDLNACHTDWREDEQERHEAWISNPDFAVWHPDNA